MRFLRGCKGWQTGEIYAKVLPNFKEMLKQAEG
jgi:hypothetical protein